MADKVSVKQVWNASIAFTGSAIKAGTEAIELTRVSMQEQLADVDMEKVEKGKQVMDDLNDIF